MAEEDKDKSVLSHINRLVKEEEFLYGQSELQRMTGIGWLN